MAKVICYLKLQPVNERGRQVGWRVTGVTQKPPSTNSLFLELNIPIPDRIVVDVPEGAVSIKLESDKIQEELYSGS